MPDYLLRVAAQNFSATVFDTNDLSTVRGASLALHERVAGLDAARLADLAGHAARAEIISSGASETFALIATDAAFNPATFADVVRTELKRMGPHKTPADLFSFGVACRPVGTDVAASAAQLEADIRAAQYRALSFPMPDDEPHSVRPCALNGRLPARPGLKIKDHPVSASVAARHSFGRERRAAYYAGILSGTDTETRLTRSGFGFSDSLADLLAQRGDAVDPPPSLSGKIALLMLDGNGFQARRIALLNSENGAAKVAKFSAFVLARQTALLGKLIDFALERSHMTMLPADGRAGRRLRIETLLWGGDEVMLALPAWAAWDVALLVEEALANWILPECDFPGLTARERTLTHAIGLLYGNYKTPIRQMKSLAADLVDQSKLAGKDRNNVSAFAFESVDLPRGGLARAQASLFGATSSRLTISADVGGFAEATRRLNQLKRVLPRSQATRRALAARDAAQDTGRAHWAEETRAELRRVLPSRDAIAAIELLGLGQSRANAALPAVESAPALALLQALHLWDYVQPLGAGCNDPDEAR